MSLICLSLSGTGGTTANKPRSWLRPGLSPRQLLAKSPPVRYGYLPKPHARSSRSHWQHTGYATPKSKLASNTWSKVQSPAKHVLTRRAGVTRPAVSRHAKLLRIEGRMYRVAGNGRSLLRQPGSARKRPLAQSSAQVCHVEFMISPALLSPDKMIAAAWRFCIGAYVVSSPPIAC